MANILVLDDLEANRMFLNKLLSRSGHRVLEAVNGAEGLGIAKVERPDLVIADILMPKMDGYEFVRALREDADCAETEVIFFTAAYDEQEVRRMAAMSGVRHVLLKPAAPSTILDLVGDALGERGTTDISIDSEGLQREHLRTLNEKLLQKLSEVDRLSEERRQLLSHLVRAQDEERRRIASDIHDDSIQVMAAATIRLSLLKEKVDDPEQKASLERVEKTIALSIERLRQLMFRLRPPALEREGLKAALEDFLVYGFADSGIEVEVESKLPDEPPPKIRDAAYQIISEALMNVRKHAEASTTKVTLSHVKEGLLVTVVDDGKGFQSGGMSSPPGHLGLINMRERAELLAGRCRVDSSPGRGSTVEIWLPWRFDDKYDTQTPAEKTA